MHKSRFVALLAAASLAVACADAGPLGSPAAKHPATSRSAAPAEMEAREVGRALALAMARQDVRVQVRNALRRSPLTEHKLVLQEFVRSRAGEHVLRAAATATGQSAEALAARINALPAMDFYAPFREHRITWRASGDVLVGVTMDPDRMELEAFSTAGASVSLDARDGVPAAALLILHPAEPKGLRENPQPDVAGEVIQDFVDGETSGGWSGGAEGGITTASDCDPYARTCFNVGGGGTSNSDTTFVDFIELDHWDDGWGSAEIELKATYYRYSGTQVTTGSMRREGLYWNTPYYIHDKLILREIPQGSGDYINVRVIELDAFFNDDQGNRDYTFGEKAQIIGIWTGDTYWEGNIEKKVWTRLELDWRI
jgi:hypothetical protein